VQGGKGSRLFGGLPGIKWKPRITIGEVGGTFFGPDGVEVRVPSLHTCADLALKSSTCP